MVKSPHDLEATTISQGFQLQREREQGKGDRVQGDLGRVRVSPEPRSSRRGREIEQGEKSGRESE